jgi:hypothetical protein
MNSTTIAATTPNCPYQAWTGHPLPVSRKVLWNEYKRLSEPTSKEFAAAKAAAAAACHTAAMNATAASCHTMTHCVIGDEGHDIGLFDSAETAFAWAREGETVMPLDTPVVRDDCRPVKGTSGWGVW